MGVPKKRVSHARKGKRRSHQALRAPSLSVCPKCKAYKLPHRVCPNCGTYKGVQYFPVRVV